MKNESHSFFGPIQNYKEIKGIENVYIKNEVSRDHQLENSEWNGTHNTVSAKVSAHRRNNKMQP